MSVKVAEKRVARGRPRTGHALPSLPSSSTRIYRRPPLENGDRLTRQEFERRYEAMPRLKKAELIEGVVRMPTPAHFENHARPHAHTAGWLALYSSATPGVFVGDNATLRLDAANELQPDALLRLDPARGGRCQVTNDDYLEGPPELIVEIAASSVSHDLHEKLTVYRRNEVQEYLVWRVYDERIDWFHLVEGEYVPTTPDGKGVMHSQVFPGLCLEVAAMLAGDLAKVLATLQKGLRSAAHTAFVRKLQTGGWQER